MNQDKDKHFKTSNFYLAAFLVCQKLELLSIDKENPRKAIFVFQDKKNRQSFVEDFLFGRAIIDPKSFVSAIKELKQLLYSNL